MQRNCASGEQTTLPREKYRVSRSKIARKRPVIKHQFTADEFSCDIEAVGFLFTSVRMISAPG
jgi:hypothetical protein